MIHNYNNEITKITETQKDVNKDSLIELSDEQVNEIELRKMKQTNKLSEDQFFRYNRTHFIRFRCKIISNEIYITFIKS